MEYKALFNLIPFESVENEKKETRVRVNVKGLDVSYLEISGFPLSFVVMTNELEIWKVKIQPCISRNGFSFAIKAEKDEE